MHILSLTTHPHVAFLLVLLPAGKTKQELQMCDQDNLLHISLLACAKKVTPEN